MQQQCFGDSDEMVLLTYSKNMVWLAFLGSLGAMETAVIK